MTLTKEKISGLYTTTIIESYDLNGCFIQHFIVVSNLTGEILDNHLNLYGEKAEEMADQIQQENSDFSLRDNCKTWIFLGTR